MLQIPKERNDHDNKPCNKEVIKQELGQTYNLIFSKLEKNGHSTPCKGAINIGALDNTIAIRGIENYQFQSIDAMDVAHVSKNYVDMIMDIAEFPIEETITESVDNTTLEIYRRVAMKLVEFGLREAPAALQKIEDELRRRKVTFLAPRNEYPPAG